MCALIIANPWLLSKMRVLINVIPANVLIEHYNEKYKSKFLLMWQTSCRIFRINKNIAIISEFTVPVYAISAYHH
jgi:hypothetical protein